MCFSITEIVSVVETTLSHYNVTITNSPVFTSSKQVCYKQIKIKIN